MNAWNVVPMGKLCSIQSGKSDTKDAVPDGPYAFFDRSKTVKRSNRYLRDCEALILPGEGTEFLPRHHIGKFDLHQRAYALFDFRPEICVKFLYYFLHYSADYFPRVAVGATVKSLRLRHFEDLPVAVTDIETQHRIVTLLDEAFADIATAKANAEKNLQNARDFFAGQLQAVFDYGVDNWDSSTLGQVYDVRDGTHDSPKYHDEGFPLITSKNLKHEGLNFDDVKLISLEDYNKINERSAVHQGDVLLAMIGTIGNPTVVETTPNFAIKNVALLKVPENQNSYFLRYYLSSPSVVAKMQAEAKGTTQKFVGLGYLRAFPISVPELSEQEQIVRKLDELRTEKNRLEAIYRQKITALDDLKKSLLHQAFSGQL